MRSSLLASLVLVAFLVPAHAAGIDWYEGDVSSAFELAKREKKPLFLYWGAVWCPPCNQIKKTIFTQHEFIEKTKLFVPVYLDGDTESAQTWGEKLEVWGYPTMLVLNPDGREVMRMPTGLQLEQFNRVLDEALEQMTPIAEVLDEALNAEDPTKIPEATFRLLAYYSWAQDRSLELPAAEGEAKFRELETRVPKHMSAERSRIWVLWLEAAMALTDETADTEEPFALTRAELDQADRRLRAILYSPELTIANLEFLSYYAGEVIPFVHPEEGRDRSKLETRWLRMMRSVEENTSLSVRERLAAALPVIDIYEIDRDEDAPYNTDIQIRIGERVAWANDTAEDPYTRQAMISTAGYMLRRVGLDEDAKQLYEAEIERSDSPYYFMSSLASMAKEEGDNEKAVYWMARAYDAAEGRATRFQWGTSYLIGLMDLLPEETARIQEESLRVFRELLALDDAFSGRNNARIERLAKKYAEWNGGESREKVIGALRGELSPSCKELSEERVEEDETIRGRCDQFFDSLGQS